MYLIRRLNISGKQIGFYIVKAQRSEEKFKQQKINVKS